jgi:hypothetical protein
MGDEFVLLFVVAAIVRVMVCMSWVLNCIYLAVMLLWSVITLWYSFMRSLASVSNAMKWSVRFSVEFKARVIVVVLRKQMWRIVASMESTEVVVSALMT